MEKYLTDIFKETKGERLFQINEFGLEPINMRTNVSPRLDKDDVVCKVRYSIELFMDVLKGFHYKDNNNHEREVNYIRRFFLSKVFGEFRHDLQKLLYSLDTRQLQESRKILTMILTKLDELR